MIYGETHMYMEGGEYERREKEARKRKGKERTSPDGPIDASRDVYNNNVYPHSNQSNRSNSNYLWTDIRTDIQKDGRIDPVTKMRGRI